MYQNRILYILTRHTEGYPFLSIYSLIQNYSIHINNKTLRLEKFFFKKHVIIDIIFNVFSFHLINFKFIVQVATADNISQLILKGSSTSCVYDSQQ